MNCHHVCSGHSSQSNLTFTDWYFMNTDARDYWMHTSSTRLHLSQTYGWPPLCIHWYPVRLLCWPYTLSCRSQEYSDVLSFHAWLCVCGNPLLKVVLGLSLMLEYGYPLCRSSKPAYCKYYNRTANRMHRCCSQVICDRVQFALCSVFGRIKLLFSVYCMLLCGTQNYTNI